MPYADEPLKDSGSRLNQVIDCVVLEYIAILLQLTLQYANISINSLVMN